MKKAFLVSLVAAAFLALPAPKASAWTNFKISGGLCIVYTHVPSFIRIPNPYAYPPPVQGAAAVGFNPGYVAPRTVPPWQAPAPLPGPANPSASPRATAQNLYGYPWGSGYQQVGYQYPIVGTAPSYWYGN